MLEVAPTAAAAVRTPSAAPATTSPGRGAAVPARRRVRRRPAAPPRDQDVLGLVDR